MPPNVSADFGPRFSFCAEKQRNDVWIDKTSTQFWEDHPHSSTTVPHWKQAIYRKRSECNSFYVKFRSFGVYPKFGAFFFGVHYHYWKKQIVKLCTYFTKHNEIRSLSSLRPIYVGFYRFRRFRVPILGFHRGYAVATRDSTLEIYSRSRYLGKTNQSGLYRCFDL